jgi:signal transduction histidine kinase
MVNRERAFSADASHQLRTPLQALRLQLEAAELRGDAPPETAEALRQVDRLGATINTLLAVARDMPRSVSPIDVDAIVEDTRERWHGPLAAHSRPLRARATQTSLRADADTRIVEQILDILLDNALLHGAGTVTICVRAVDRWVAIDVSDEGPGFPDDAPDPFERRTTAAEAHGIGLALARSLAHAEGGTIALTRAAPAATLTLFLPRSDTPPGR